MVSLMAYTVATIAMAVAAISTAWSAHHTYYATMQHLLHTSKLSTVVLMNCAICGTILFGKLLTRTFLSRLRDLEVEHLYEKLAYTITESLLAVAMFRADISVDLFAMLSVLLFLKLFHWIVADRVDFVPQAPAVSMWTLARLFMLMAILTVGDVVLLSISIQSVAEKGFSMMVLFGFEFIVLVTTMSSLGCKLLLHAVDLTLLDGAWDRKGTWIFYIELVTDVMNLTTYIIFFGAIVIAMGIPIHIIRDIYVTFRNLQRRLQDLMRYRRATQNMETRYPDATEEELSALSDRVCIVCRDDLTVGKKLPCGHIFHLRCLRSWLERQQTCPICRMDVLEQVERIEREQTPPVEVQENVEQPPHHAPPPVPHATWTPPPLPVPTPTLHTPSSSLPPVNVLLDSAVPLQLLESLVEETEARRRLVDAELKVLGAVLAAKRVQDLD